MDDQSAIAINGSFFQQIHLPHQKNLIDGVQFPTVLSPIPHSSAKTHLLHLTEAIKSHKQWLEDLLQKSGAILFRGFPVDSPSDFNDVIEATGFPDMEYIGGAALRTQVSGRVFTANESPPDQHIAFHHEMAYAADFPFKVLLFCEVEPEEGGETPIVLSHIVYEKMKRIHPAFVARLEEHGLLYTRLLNRDDDLTSPSGRGWQSTFSTHDKTIAEQRAAKMGMKLEWIDDDGLDSVKMIIGPLSAFRVDKARQSKTWFNSLVVGHGHGSQDNSTVVQPDPVTFGDGKPIPVDMVYDCIKILEEECVAIPWKKGDVLLIDNLAVLHSRRPCVNSQARSRRVLASLCK
ncbi:clavaminate synthase-like protein At3g21360 [Cynara cardunculus var. scolymus]|nr:clavaminate synthase-like protein At3g21360 [Cynara cardunculus var. scolymus]